MDGKASPSLILDAAVKAAASVLPGALFDGTVVENKPGMESGMCVFVGVTGDFRCSLVIEGQVSLFSAVGASMFGMELDELMLESFAGELGNMVAGNMATHATASGMTLDITPPRVIVGASGLGAPRQSWTTSAQVEGAGNVHLHLCVEEDAAVQAVG